jgi:hypothetical protein
LINGRKCNKKEKEMVRHTMVGQLNDRKHQQDSHTHSVTKQPEESQMPGWTKIAGGQTNGLTDKW